MEGCKKEDSKIVLQQQKEEVTRGQKEKTTLLYGKWQFQKYEEFINGEKGANDDAPEEVECRLKEVLSLTETKYSLTAYSFDKEKKECKSDGTSEYDYVLKDNTITIQDGGQVYEFIILKDNQLILTSIIKEKDVKSNKERVIKTVT